MTPFGGVSGDRYAPYCGAPPDPANIFTRWNFDPVLVVGLLAVIVGYWAWSRAARGPGPARQMCFCAGWAIGALTLVSPLCALSVSLFSARVVQHMILAALAAPLLMIGWPINARSSATTRGGGRGWIAAIVFAATFWFWHAPGAYAATFAGGLVYWMMHFTIIGSALWLWAELVRNPASQFVDRLAAIAITTLQMSTLGAIVTFAPRPLYAVHALTTSAWGLTPLEDQQLGGAVMWIPAGAIFVATLLLSLAAVMRQDQSRPTMGAPFQ